MEDQLISFETAKLAKEVGFDELVEHGFDGDGEYASNLEYFSNSEFGGIWITSPTQSLLQRWLREVHKINIEIRCFSDDNGVADFQYSYIIYSTFVKENEDSWEYYATYEIALELALAESLNLIKK